VVGTDEERPAVAPVQGWVKMSVDITNEGAKTMSEALKPCPFCGAASGYEVPDLGTVMHVSCGSCGASGPRGKTTSENGVAWNHRAIDLPFKPGDRVEADAAGYWFHGLTGTVISANLFPSYVCEEDAVRDGGRPRRFPAREGELRKIGPALRAD
jgi:Lar family restriction alleviation protein